MSKGQDVNPENHKKISPETGPQFICPVCGNQLHETNLPDKESIVKDNLYHEGGVLILSSHVLLRCDFEHLFEREDITLDDPHKLVAFVEAAFDESGECTRFVLVGIYAAENVKSIQDLGKVDRRVK